MAEEALYRPGEVAKMFGVSPKTVKRWAERGEIECIRTLGGHRRYKAPLIDELLEENTGEVEPSS